MRRSKTTRSIKQLFGSGQLDELTSHITALRRQLRRNLTPKLADAAETTAAREDKLIDRRARIVEQQASRRAGATASDVRHAMDDITAEVTDVATRQLATDVPLVVFINDNVSASQKKMLEDMWQCSVYDRFGVILSIFETRANTKEAKLSVELALIKYIIITSLVHEHQCV